MAASSKKVIIAALIGNLLVAISRYIVAFLTGSSAMLSERIHSIVDTGNQLLMMLGLKRSKKDATDEHPFGYGKEIYFWSFTVAVLIFGIGAGISIYEGIHSLLNPHPISNVLINYIILVCAIFFEGYAWLTGFKSFRETKRYNSYIKSVKEAKNPIKFVVLFEDSAALTGLFVAILGIWLTEVTGILIFDGIAFLIIGIILGFTATWLAYETKGLLIGESAAPGTIENIENILNNFSEVESVSNIYTVRIWELSIFC